MRLTVLGCAGTFPSAASGCSSYLVEHDGFRLLMDAGPGAVGGLQRTGTLLDIDAVAISHLHADHCLDLVPYYYARSFAPSPPPVLPVWGPPGTRERLAQAFDQGAAERMDGCYRFRDLSPGRHEIGPFEVVARRMAHPVECYGLRVSAAGRSLAYSADTGPTAALVELATDADLFLCESSWADGADGDHPPDLHLTGTQAGEHAARAGARSLLLTHVVPWTSEPSALAAAASAFDGPVRAASAGATYDV